MGTVVSTLAGRTIWKKEYRLIMRERREIYEEPSAGETGVFGNICHEGRGNEPGVCD